MYKGQKTYKTGCGASGTVALYAVMFYVAVNGFVKMGSFATSGLATEYRWFDINGETNFNLNSSDFDLGFGLASGWELDSSVGSWRIEHVTRQLHEDEEV